MGRVSISRPLFVVQVLPDRGCAFVEDVRTRQCVRVTAPAEIGVQIARWLGERGLEISQPLSVHPLDDHQEET